MLFNMVGACADAARVEAASKSRYLSFPFRKILNLQYNKVIFVNQFIIL
jgi:hypothetical protein